MKSPDLSIVMPNFQGENLLDEKISILQEVMKNFSGRLIIVDDGSSDKSSEILCKRLPKCILESDENNQIQKSDLPQTGTIVVLKKKNTGFSSTCNLGVSLVNTKYFFLCNSDLLCNSQALTAGLNEFSSPDIACVTFAEKDDDGNLHGRGRFVFEKGFLLHRAHLDIKTSGASAWGSGGSSIFSKSAWDEFEGLNTIYDPFYFEDVDLGYRFWSGGYFVQYLYLPDLLFTHLHKTGAIKKNFSKDNISLNSLTHQFYFTYLNLDGFSYWLKHALYLPVHLIRSAFSSNRLFFKAFLQVLSDLPQLRKLRHQQKSIINTNAVIKLSS